MNLDEKLEWVCRQFCIKGTYVGHDTICVGNVNKTYAVHFKNADGSPKSYLVQDVNTYAFKKPVELMKNIERVTEYIRAKNPGHVALHYHHTHDHKNYLNEGDHFWRLTNYIESVTYSSVLDNEVVHNAGIAFGDFQLMLSDFDITKLTETIPGFHNTRERYNQLESAIAENPVGRVAKVQDEIDYLMSVKDQACKLCDMQAAGELPLRVTHNDTKINNVLFNPDDKTALVVVDLDTVMPGLVGNDFGDAIRFAANKVDEDCREPDKAGINLDIFKSFADGFLSKTANTLTENEIKTLSLSCICLALELSTRFLADYILGDPYFNIKYPEHNIVRTRCQIALAKDMFKHKDEMDDIIRASVEAYTK